MSEHETLRDTFAAAALTGMLRKLRPGSAFDLTITARQAFEIADAMLRERAATTHDAAPAAKAHVDAAGISRQGTGDTPTLTDPERLAIRIGDGLIDDLLAIARGSDQPPPALTDEEVAAVSGEEREAADSPATWQDECAAVEAAFERSGVRPTWPDDEPANIGPMAHAMADEVTRLRAEVERLRASPEELRAMESFCDTEAVPDIYSLVPLAKTRGQIVRDFLARHGGE